VAEQRQCSSSLHTQWEVPLQYDIVRNLDLIRKYGIRKWRWNWDHPEIFSTVHYFTDLCPTFITSNCKYTFM